MANLVADMRKEKNDLFLRRVLYFIIASNVIYLVVRAGIFHSTFKKKDWLSFMLTFFAYIIPYLQLAVMAKPMYSENDELLDGGIDLTAGGAARYLHDIIYMTGFVQLASIISEKSWYMYLVVPAFGIYKLLEFGKEFLSNRSQGDEEEHPKSS
ncbi:hypothetical protein NMG60_11013027 [Bertholletia excelsa]